MTRIVAGLAGGRRLQVPPGDRTRPTAERAREAMFSSLTSLLDLEGAAVLDLCAGSGALGLEALSRGASRATLVEQDAAVCAVLRNNVTAVGLPGAQVVHDEVERHLTRAVAQPYDVVLLDPPYAQDVSGMLAALTTGWLAEGAVVVVERSSRSPALTWPDGFEALRSKRYGEATLWYGRRS